MLYKKGRYFSTLFFYLKIFINIFVKKDNMSEKKIFLDYTTEFDDFEKRVLKQIHKVYKDTSLLDYRIWDVAIDLIEYYNLDYKHAYELSNTYYYNKEKLFSKLERQRKEVSNSYLFFHFLSDIINEWIEKEGNNLPVVPVKYKDEKIPIVESSINLSNAYKGFRCYIEPIDEEYDKYSYFELKTRYINTYFIFSKINKEGKKDDNFYYGDEEIKNIDQNKLLLELQYDIRDTSKGNIIEKYYNYPEKLSKESMMKFLDNVLEDYYSFLKTTDFEVKND